MKKTLLSLLMSGLCLAGFAQVTPPAGAVRPVVSTEDEPVWYVMT